MFFKNLTEEQVGRISHKEIKQRDSNYENERNKKKKKDYSEERKRKREQ